VTELYEGLQESARACDAQIVGGDVVRSPVMTITVALYGRAEQYDGEPLLLRRGDARAGDAIAVSGALGDSAAGLRRLREAAGADDPLVQRHLRPRARLAVASAAVHAGVRCGIDVSDGLLQDVGHICEASGVGAVIRAADVTLSDALRAAYPDEALELACTGGEDYELVLAGPRGAIDRVSDALNEGGLNVIGEIVGGEGVRLIGEDGAEIHFERAGWDAFK
jgi:thiamine-monophosphate kinase